MDHTMPCAAFSGNQCTAWSHRIDPLNPPDEESRLAAMRQYVRARSYVCLCQLIFRFHVDKLWVLAVLDELVDAGPAAP